MTRYQKKNKKKDQDISKQLALLYDARDNEKDSTKREEINQQINILWK